MISTSGRRGVARIGRALVLLGCIGSAALVPGAIPATAADLPISAPEPTFATTSPAPANFQVWGSAPNGVAVGFVPTFDANSRIVAVTIGRWDPDTGDFSTLDPMPCARATFYGGTPGVEDLRIAAGYDVRNLQIDANGRFVAGTWGGTPYVWDTASNSVTCLPSPEIPSGGTSLVDGQEVPTLVTVPTV